jgi:hypothetical protein
MVAQHSHPELRIRPPIHTRMSILVAINAPGES